MKKLFKTFLLTVSALFNHVNAAPDCLVRLSSLAGPIGETRANQGEFLVDVFMRICEEAQKNMHQLSFTFNAQKIKPEVVYRSGMVVHFSDFKQEVSFECVASTGEEHVNMKEYAGSCRAILTSTGKITKLQPSAGVDFKVSEESWPRAYRFIDALCSDILRHKADDKTQYSAFIDDWVHEIIPEPETEITFSQEGLDITISKFHNSVVITKDGEFVASCSRYVSREIDDQNKADKIYFKFLNALPAILEALKN